MFLAKVCLRWPKAGRTEMMMMMMVIGDEDENQLVFEKLCLVIFIHPCCLE